MKRKRYETIRFKIHFKTNINNNNQAGETNGYISYYAGCVQIITMLSQFSKSNQF